MRGEESSIVWNSDTSLSVSGVPYDLQHEAEPVPGRLRLYKSRPLIESYEPIIAEFRHANIFELGIFGGGSTAFFAQTCAPRSMAAIELSADRIDMLDGLLADQGLDGAVHLHYGVDQGDRDRLRAIVEHDFGGEALDLVIDDASHIYGPTRASFEVLFPRVRPGGLYIIEDWRSQDWFIRMFIGLVNQPRNDALAAIEASLAVGLIDPDAVDGRVFEQWVVRVLADPADRNHEPVRAWFASLTGPEAAPGGAVIHDRLRTVIDRSVATPGAPSVRPPTMGTLAAEMCMGMKSGHPALAEVTITAHWIAARRGSEPIDPASFTVDALADDPFAILAPHDTGAPGR